jgi:hypothetical protein
MNIDFSKKEMTFQSGGICIIQKYKKNLFVKE